MNIAKKYKLVLFDVDGVVITPPRYFGEELEIRGYENAGSILRDFFTSSEYERCLIGEGDELIEMEPFLKRIGWDKTSADYMRAHCDFEAKFLDGEIVSFIGNLKARGVSCYLVTDQVEYRKNYLLKEMNFENLFDGYFFACDVGAAKKSYMFWEVTWKKLKKKFPHLKGKEALLIDDSIVNIEVAKEFGLDTLLYKNKNNLGILI